ISASLPVDPLNRKEQHMISKTNWHYICCHSRPFERPVFVLLSIFLFGLPPASARITHVEITSVQSPTFGGSSFGSIGQYEKVVGKVFGEVDPDDRRNTAITDIRIAPRNARGMVEYSMDIYILRPVDTSKGNRRVLFEINNRGNKRILNGPFGNLNNAVSGGNDPTTAADAGDGFLMR